jgi:hypothetical protein
VLLSGGVEANTPTLLQKGRQFILRRPASKKVAAKLFILQDGAGPLFSVPVWAEPSQLLLGNWPTTRRNN